MVKEKDKIKFPHLLPGETTVWRRFLERYEDDYERYEYDVHIGLGSLPQAPAGDVWALDFNWLTRKRIDVIGYKGKRVTIFEVRARASLPLMGQLEGYQYLWMRQTGSEIAPNLVMVCEAVPADDLEVFIAHGIDVVVV